MERKVYDISKANYKFDASRRNNKYTFDGIKWVNAGEAIEILLKFVLGLLAKKDPNTGWNEGNDIEEYKASVKSPNFTLVNSVIGETFEEVKEEYFKHVASEIVIFGIIAGDELITYWMDMNEFDEYLKEFGTWEKTRKVIRGKKLSNQMVTWLEKRVVE